MENTSKIAKELPQPTKDTMMDRIWDNPAFPVACLAGAAAVGFGMYSYRQGNQNLGQFVTMKTPRTIAAGLGFVALVGGAAWIYRNKL